MKGRIRQRGAALILMAAILVLGLGWYTVRALNTIAPAASEREVRTGRALQAAKQALLAYVAQYAARSNTADPGQMPCPESLTLANPGQSSSSCSASAIVAGRLPWKTLGVDPVLDGNGEPLWYVMRGFRDPPINFGSAGQLTYNGSAVVAMIIAPGSPLNTAGTAGTPPAGCTKQSQTRSVASLSAANYLECGVASGSVAAPGDPTWTNDRVITITTAEWVAAIAAPVADRLQREVAPALADWRSTESDGYWGERFLPAASTFSSPASNALCGTYGTREGLMPLARSAASTCATWTGGNISQLVGLIGGQTCAQVGTNYRCQFTNLSSLPPLLVTRVRAQAPAAGQSFRAPIAAGDIVVSNGGTVSDFSLVLDPATGEASLDFRVSLPALGTTATTITVTIPNLPDPALFADVRLAWFLNNDWAHHTYYTIAPGSQLDAASDCASDGDAACMTLNGMPAANGNTADKRFVLALVGPALGAQSRPSNSNSDYIESRTNSMTYHQDRIDTVFNDRLATCPFQQTPASGPVMWICN